MLAHPEKAEEGRQLKRLPGGQRHVSADISRLIVNARCPHLHSCRMKLIFAKVSNQDVCGAVTLACAASHYFMSSFQCFDPQKGSCSGILRRRTKLLEAADA